MRDSLAPLELPDMGGVLATTAAVLRRAAAVGVPRVPLIFAGMLGSSVAVEQLFAVPGARRTALRAVLA